MIQIGIVKAEQKCDGVINDVTCPNCHSVTQAPMIRIIQTGYIIFIPFFKKTVSCYTKCPCCGMEYRIPSKTYKSILQTSNSELLFNECNKLLQASKNKELQYEEKSNRSWCISWLLALIFGIFGLQHWYMGFKKRGFISICLLAVGILSLIGGLTMNLAFASFLFAICIAFNVYWGLFDTIKILIGKAKDGNNKYIMTEGQYQKHLNNLQRFR